MTLSKNAYEVGAFVLPPQKSIFRIKTDLDTTMKTDDGDYHLVIQSFIVKKWEKCDGK